MRIFSLFVAYIHSVGTYITLSLSRRYGCGEWAKSTEKGDILRHFFPFFAAFGYNLPARFLQYETVGAGCVGYEVSYSGKVTPCSMVHV